MGHTHTHTQERICLIRGPHNAEDDIILQPSDHFSVRGGGEARGEDGGGGRRVSSATQSSVESTQERTRENTQRGEHAEPAARKQNQGCLFCYSTWLLYYIHTYYYHSTHHHFPLKTKGEASVSCAANWEESPVVGGGRGLGGHH